MSFVSKMQIRGIRSFSPDHDETIEFYSPLTMIVGANGCGKTTIIESLKFACTGSLPPNTKGGSSFINDPSMTDTTDVKAHIKLRFQNRSDQTCVAVRSLQVLKKRSKLEYKALEGVLRTTNNQGEKVSLSMKCSDMDRILPENIGVSPAIVENVIFCHQEESNWPMQEGVVLKKKFDDIFESTRYTKALEALSKAKKDFASKAKDLKGEMMEFGAHLLTANQYKSDYDICEENRSSCEQNLNEINEKLQVNQIKLTACNEVVSITKSSTIELQQLQLQLSEAQRRVQEKSRSLEQILKCDDRELQHMLNNFDSAMTTKRNEYNSMKSRIATLNDEINALRQKGDEINLRKGQAQALENQSKQLKEEIVSICQQIKTKYFISDRTTSWEWSLNLMDSYQQHIEKEMRRVSAECNEMLSKSKSVLDLEEKNVSDCKNLIQKVDVELTLKNQEYHSVVSDIDNTRVELSRLSASRSILHQAEADYENSVRSHDEFMQSYTMKSNDIKKQLKDTTDQMRTIQEQLTSDAQVLQDLNLNRSEIAAMEATAKQIELDENQVLADVLSIYHSNREILSVYDQPKDVGYLAEKMVPDLNTRLGACQRDYNTTNDQCKRLSNQIAANEALIAGEVTIQNNLRVKLNSLAGKENTLRSLIDRLNMIRRGKVLKDSEQPMIPLDSPLHEVLEATHMTEEEAHELLIIAKSGRIFVKRMKKIRKQKNGACPCCGQSMNTEVAARYETNLKSITSFNDEEEMGTLEEHEEIRNECKQLSIEVKLLQNDLQPLTDMKANLLQSEVKVKELSLTNNQIQLEYQQQDGIVQEIQRKQQNMAKVVMILQELSIRWQNIHKRKQDVMEKRRRQTQSSMMSYTMTNEPVVSIHELEALQRNRNEEKDELQNKKDKLQVEEANLTKRFYYFKNLLIEKEKSINVAKLDGNRCVELEAMIVRYQQRIDEIEERKIQLNRERDGLLRDLNEKQMKLNSVKINYQQLQETNTVRLDGIRTDRDGLNKLTQQLQDMMMKIIEMNPKKLQEDGDQVQLMIQNYQSEITELGPLMNQIHSDLASQEHTKRNVVGNIELRENELERLDIMKRLDELEERLGIRGNSSNDAMNVMEQLKKAEAEADALNQVRSHLLTQRDTIRAKMEVYHQQSLDYKLKLAQPNYKGVEERHRRKSIEFETTSMAVSDLDNYYHALDRALQNFHTLKIREINKIIRELWQLIYKGQDIDMIEIESGQDESQVSGATAASTAKGPSRSYNYRVVMSKGGVQLDMRGRCSAGQKVLAAIVIRLALAETFCLNCGLLALDEPTTNLDEANKAGLAHALARLIMSRSKQQNFQLICITHDEDFVRLMSSELATSGGNFTLPEHYFRVYRDEDNSSGKFFSHIERINWEDM